jgi:hypothetical protein
MIHGHTRLTNTGTCVFMTGSISVTEAYVSHQRFDAFLGKSKPRQICFYRLTSAGRSSPVSPKLNGSK